MKKLLFSLLLLAMTGAAFAQSEHGYTIKGDNKKDRDVNTDWMDKFYVGGGIGGLSFSSASTSIGLNFVGGYRWTDRLNTGVGLGYQYYENKYYDYKYNIYSTQFFTQYQVYGPIYAMGMYEYNFLNFNGDNYNYDGLFFGGAYNQPLGGNAVVSFMVMYNVLYDDLNKEDGYSSPLYYGVNIMVGF